MRVIPRMVVISPCDAIEAKKATMVAAKTNDPTYIRLAREKNSGYNKLSRHLLK